MTTRNRDKIRLRIFEAVEVRLEKCTYFSKRMLPFMAGLGCRSADLCISSAIVLLSMEPFEKVLEEAM